MTTKKSAVANAQNPAGPKPTATKVKASGAPVTRKRVATRSASVVMQARVDEAFARALVDEDAVVLGLDGPSELVREGLRLVHERALEAAMAAAYDDFYAGKRAPLPAGVVAAGRK